MLAIALRCLLLSFLVYVAQTTTLRKESKIHELYASNISSNLLDWETDMAILFYSPRCKYCKQMLPSWESIATASSKNSDLLIGQFNCENPIDHSEICSNFGVDRYPSIYFIGYGNYNQAPRNKPFGKNLYPNLVRYNADLYPEAINHWIIMLNKISWFKRQWNNFLSIFNGKERLKKWNNYKRKLDSLEKKVRLFSNELEKYKALELFDSLEDYGDVFPLLHTLEPDEQNLPLRSCVADMAAEFCKYFEKDEYCQSLSECSEQDLEPEACRPKECPFEDKRGCTVVSTCMKPGIVEEYKKAYAQSKVSA